ncbi:hypothetical protein C8F01DRAFT_1147481 [Mycena amicta]|nr:hypothetical protein C8F01DRAFT_1147481 [Mycena amicta]
MSTENPSQTSCVCSSTSPFALTGSRRLSHLLDTNDPPLDSEIPRILHTIRGLETRMEAATQLVDGRTISRDDEILELARSLRKHRAILSPARRLPPEIICDILRYSLPDDYVSGARQSTPPWTLGHICNSWRRTALGYSVLWSFIVIARLTSAGPTSSLAIPRFVAALQCQLSRTNNAALSVFVWGPQMDTPEVLSLLISTAARWKLLRFSGITPGRSELHWTPQLQGHLKALERLEFLDSGGVAVYDVFSQNVPRLRTIDLFEAGFADHSPYLRVPFGQITRYRAAWDTHRHMVNLSSAQNLEVCVLGIVSPAREYELVVPPVHLPRLRVLHLENPEFLDCLTAPVLEYLAVFSNASDEPIHNVLPFLQRSGCAHRLRQLSIMECQMPGADLVPLLHALPSLETLVLEFSITEPGMEPTLQALTIGDGADELLCPKLASFTYGYVDQDESLECLAMLPALARSRARFLSLKSQRFELYIYECASDDLVSLPETNAFNPQALADDGVDLVCMSSTDPRVVKERWGDF